MRAGLLCAVDVVVDVDFMAMSVSMLVLDFTSYKQRGGQSSLFVVLVLVNSIGFALVFLDLGLLLSHLGDLFVVLVVFLVDYSCLIDAVLASFLWLPIGWLDLVETFDDLLFGFADGCSNFSPLLAFAFQEQ